MTHASPSARFPSTAWTCIRTAQDATHPDFTAALQRLMVTYWRPVFHYLRALGHSAHDAEDLTQAFFLRFLVHGLSQPADQQRGRFRDYLRTLVKRFAYRRTVRATEQTKFESRFASLASLMQDSDRAYEPPAHETPDQAFDRQWKADVLAAVRRNLQACYEDEDKPVERQRFAIFAACHCIDRAEDQPTLEAVAERFGVTREQVKYAVQVVKSRYERLLRQEIRDQVGPDVDVEAEIRNLV